MKLPSDHAFCVLRNSVTLLFFQNLFLNTFLGFSEETQRLQKKVCPSVGPSVCKTSIPFFFLIRATYGVKTLLFVPLTLGLCNMITPSLPPSSPRSPPSSSLTSSHQVVISSFIILLLLVLLYFILYPLFHQTVFSSFIRRSPPLSPHSPPLSPPSLPTPSTELCPLSSFSSFYLLSLYPPLPPSRYLLLCPFFLPAFLSF